MGMYCEALLSSLLGLIDRKSVERVGSLIGSYGPPLKMPSGVDEERIISSMPA